MVVGNIAKNNLKDDFESRFGILYMFCKYVLSSECVSAQLIERQSSVL